MASEPSIFDVPELQDPDFGPLEKAVGAGRCGEWLWMSRAEIDGHLVQQYKRIDTRAYINLRADGKAWYWGRWRTVNLR